MQRTTRELWTRQDQHPGDRYRLFRAVAAATHARTVLYPGSYVDLAPSFVFPAVTYADVDRRAARFFADRAGVLELIAEQRVLLEPAAPPTTHAVPRVTFLAADYTADLGLRDVSFDLLVSLYAGFVSEACTRYLRLGGTLLVNPSHGDAALASLDPRYRLTGAVVDQAGDYRITTAELETYLVPKGGRVVTRDEVRRSGRGVACTRAAFAYLFERVG